MEVLPFYCFWGRTRWQTERRNQVVARLGKRWKFRRRVTEVTPSSHHGVRKLQRAWFELHFVPAPRQRTEWSECGRTAPQAWDEFLYGDLTGLDLSGKKACLRREPRLRCEETWLAPERTAILYQSMREHASVA